MAVTIDDFMSHINADSDEHDYCVTCLNDATSIIKSILQNEGVQFSSEIAPTVSIMTDRAIEEYATNLYLSRDGQMKTSTKNVASLGFLLNYIRMPSI